MINWKSKAVFSSKPIPLYTAFFHSITLSGYRIGTKFDKDPLAVEKNKYLSKTENVYIVYDQMLGQEILLKISNLKIAYLEQLIW